MGEADLGGDVGCENFNRRVEPGVIVVECGDAFAFPQCPQVGCRRIIRLHQSGFRAAFNGHVAQGHPFRKGHSPNSIPAEREGEIVGAVGAYFPDEMEHKILGACPLSHRSPNMDLHCSWDAEPELSRQHDPAHVGGPYAEGKHVKGAVCACMGVGTHGKSSRRNEAPLDHDLVTDSVANVEKGYILGRCKVPEKYVKVADPLVGTGSGVVEDDDHFRRVPDPLFSIFFECLYGDGARGVMDHGQVHIGDDEVTCPCIHPGMRRYYLFCRGLSQAVVLLSFSSGSG